MKKVLAAHDVTIDIDLNLGNDSATVWSCDTNYASVKLNADYTT